MNIERKGRRLIKDPFWMVLLPVFLSVGLLIYSEVLRHGVFLFDDFVYVIGNPLITDLSSTNISDPRQLGYFTFALNYTFGGEDPFGYHLVNVLIHIVNSLLVFSLIMSLVTALKAAEEQAPVFRNIACLTALVFLVHPIQTQAVSYVTQRFTSLATCFYLLSILFYVKARLRFEGGQNWIWHYIAALIVTVLAMKTKEIAFTIPFVLCMLEIAALQESKSGKLRLFFLLPFVTTLLIIPLSIMGPDWGIINPGTGIAEVSRVAKIYDVTELSPLNYLFTQFRVIVTYIHALLLPVGLRVIYDFRVSQEFIEPAVIGSFLFLLVLLSCAIYLLRKSSSMKGDRDKAVRYRLISLGIFWFFITLSVESTVIPIKDVIFEHRVYLPSAGFFMAGSVLIMSLSERYLIWRSPLLKIALPALLIAVPLATGTYIRNEVWTDEVKLWDDVVQKSPNKPIGYNNRGIAYAARGRTDEAVKEFKTALRLNPDYAEAHYNLGIAYLAQGRIDEAVNEYQAVLKLNPDHYNAYNNLGHAYLSKGQYDLAIEQLQAGLRMKPDYAEAHNNLGHAYVFKGQYDLAIEQYRIVLRLDPDSAATHFNLGLIYLKTGSTDKARTEFESALKLNPDDDEARQRLNSLMSR